jgi:hypothetical protein
MPCRTLRRSLIPITSTPQTLKALTRLLRFAPALRVTVRCVPVRCSYAGKRGFPAAPERCHHNQQPSYYAGTSVLQFKLELKAHRGDGAS